MDSSAIIDPCIVDCLESVLKQVVDVGDESFEFEILDESSSEGEEETETEKLDLDTSNRNNAALECISDSEDCMVVSPIKPDASVALHTVQHTQVTTEIRNSQNNHDKPVTDVPETAEEDSKKGSSRCSDEFLLNNECILCHRKFFSPQAWTKHCTTEGHKKKLEVYWVLNGDRFEVPNTALQPSLSAVLNNHSQKIIGLDHIYEFHVIDGGTVTECMFVWACDCCYVAGHTYTSARKHVLSDTHRLNIIEQYYSSAKPTVEIGKLDSLTKVLDTVCATIHDNTIQPQVLTVNKGGDEACVLNCVSDCAETSDALLSQVQQWIHAQKHTNGQVAVKELTPSDDIIIEEELPKWCKTVPTADKSILLFCHVCRDCFSPSSAEGTALQAVEMHNNDKKHKRYLTLKKQFKLDKNHYVDISADAQIQHDAAKMNRPVGLEYIVERHQIRRKRGAVDLVCTLCCHKMQTTFFVDHVKGVEHRKKFVMSAYPAECEKVYRASESKQEAWVESVLERERPARRRVNIYYPKLANFYAHFVNNNLTAFAGGSRITRDTLKKDHLLNKGLLDILRGILEGSTNQLSRNRAQELEAHNLIKNSSDKLFGAEDVVVVEYIGPDSLKTTYYCSLCVTWTSCNKLVHHLKSTNHKVKWLKHEHKRKPIFGIQVCNAVKAKEGETKGRLNDRKALRIKEDKLACVIGGERCVQQRFPGKKSTFKVDSTLIKKLWTDGCQRNINSHSVADVKVKEEVRPSPPLVSHQRAGTKIHTIGSPNREKSLNRKGRSPIQRARRVRSPERTFVRSPVRSPVRFPVRSPVQYPSRSPPPSYKKTYVESTSLGRLVSQSEKDDYERRRKRRHRRRSRSPSRTSGSKSSRRSRSRTPKRRRRRTRSRSRSRTPTSRRTDERERGQTHKFRDVDRPKTHTYDINMPKTHTYGMDRPMTHTYDPIAHQAMQAQPMDLHQRPLAHATPNWRQLTTQQPAASAQMDSYSGLYQSVTGFGTNLLDQYNAGTASAAATYSPLPPKRNTEPAAREASLEMNLEELLSPNRATTSSEQMLIKLLLSEKKKQEETKKAQDAMMELLQGLTQQRTTASPINLPTQSSTAHQPTAPSARYAPTVYDYTNAANKHVSAPQPSSSAQREPAASARMYRHPYGTGDASAESDLVRDAAVNVLASQRSASATTNQVRPTRPKAPATNNNLADLMAELQKYGIGTPHK